MIEGQTAAIIAGASAIGGGMIVAVSNYAINRAQARDSRKAELRKALINLWDAVAQVDHRLRIEPEPKKTSRAVDEAMSARAPQMYHTIGLIRRRLLDPTLDDLTAATMKALSAATVLAPPNLLPALADLTEAMDGADHRDDEWWSRWNSARTEYFLKCRETVGHSVPQQTAGRMAIPSGRKQ